MASQNLKIIPISATCGPQYTSGLPEGSLHKSEMKSCIFEQFVLVFRDKNEDCSRNLIKSGGVCVVDTEQILTRIFCIKSIGGKVFCRQWAGGGKNYKKKEKREIQRKKKEKGLGGKGGLGGRQALAMFCSINQLIESLINRSMRRLLFSLDAHLLTTIGTGSARMKTPMRAQSPPIS